MEPELGSEAAGTAQLPLCTAQLPALPAQRRRPPRPSTLHMVMEALRALQAQGQRKGVSVVAIKRFILCKYPSVDPIRLKYLLKQALSKGLSCGDLVRPHNSSAMGATGSFRLASKMPQKRQAPGQADANRGQAPELGRKGTTKTLRAPTAGETQPGTKEKKLAVAKKPAAARKLKAKLVDAKPPAAGKTRSDGAKPSQAAGHLQTQGKSCSRPRVAAAVKDTGRDHNTNSMGARAKEPHRALAGQSKGRTPKTVQKDPPEAKGGPGKARKPQVTPGAGKGEKAAPKATARKGP